MKSFELSVNSGWVEAILLALEEYDISKKDILINAGLNPEWISVPSATYPMEGVTNLWRIALDLHGPGIGIKVARHFRPRHWSTLGIALLSSIDTRDFLNRVSRYHVLAADMVRTWSEPSDFADVKVVTAFTHPIQFEQERLEALIGSSFTLGRYIHENSPRPARVDLTRIKPKNPKPWYEFFGKKIQWAMPSVAIHLTEKQLNTRSPMIDEELSKLQESVLAERLKAYNFSTVSGRARREILKALPSGDLSIERVSERLFLSKRTLQRKLNEEGVTFRELADLVRFETAKGYLSSTDHPLKEVAFLTGFSNQSNFSNAFKKWANQTPQSFRTVAKTE